MQAHDYIASLYMSHTGIKCWPTSYITGKYIFKLLHFWLLLHYLEYYVIRLNRNYYYYYLRQGGYVFASVSLFVSVCVCHQDYAKSY